MRPIQLLVYTFCLIAHLWHAQVLLGEEPADFSSTELGDVILSLEKFVDLDGDGVEDALDDDDDGDGIGDHVDACPAGTLGDGSGPLNADRDQDGCDDVTEDLDDDGDGIDDAVDDDLDNDGFTNDVDACPTGLVGDGGAANKDDDLDGCDDLAEDLDDDADGILDDAVTVTCNLLLTADTEVKENSANTNFGTRTVIKVNRARSDSPRDARRIYLYVDLEDPCLETGWPLPRGVEIEEAYLRLFTNNGNTQSTDVFRVSSADDWSEGTITWQNQPAVFPQSTSTKVTTHKNRWLTEWDVADDVRLFAVGMTNRGWRLAASDESIDAAGKVTEYMTKENTALDIPRLHHPRLQIRYRTTVPRSTIGDEALLITDPTLDQATSGARCDAGTDVYQLPYGRNKLLVGQDLADQLSLRDISDSLLLLDHADALFSDMFGYDFSQDLPAREPEIRVCSDVNNAGTDNTQIGMPASQYLGSSQDDGQDLQADFLTTLIHEKIHTWMHRRGKFFLQDSGGHNHLYGIEPGFYEMARQGFMNDLPTSPEMRRFALYHSSMERYLADPGLDWETYFSPAAIAAFEAGTSSRTEDRDRDGILNGIFEWIRRVHGVDGLGDFHRQVEIQRLANGWSLDRNLAPDLSATERNEFLLLTLIDAFEVDVAAYFDFWKFPVTTELRAYSETFPDGPGVLDGDNDGFTPLQGDFDDGDDECYPGAPELMDGKDNNFDGQIDELMLEDSAGSDLPEGTEQTLPLVLFGEIEDGADVDGIDFHLAEPGLVTFILRAVDSDQIVFENGTGREISTFVGAIRVDGEWVRSSGSRLFQYGTLSIPLAAGSHRVEVYAAQDSTFPANPGTYVLQVYEDDFQSQGLTGLEGTADLKYKFFNGSTPLADFDCSGVKGMPQAQCQVLVDVFDNLGGNAWPDVRGWLADDEACFWKGVRCDATGIQRLLLAEGRNLDGIPRSLDWSALSSSLTVLEMRGDGLTGPLPTEFGTLALDRFEFDPSGGLCLPAELQTWFDGINHKSGNLPACCVDDPDGDGLCAEQDNCPAIANPDQSDVDMDGQGDVCDVCTFDADNDADADGFCANVDNCPAITNPGQEDADMDLVGDVCDVCVFDPFDDEDADGLCADADNCPAASDQSDTDFDGLGDVCDLCLGDNDNGDEDMDNLCLGWDCDDTDGLGEACYLFGSNFETGDVSDWSSSVP